MSSKATMSESYGHMVAAACATCCTLGAHAPIGNEAKWMHNSATYWPLRMRSSWDDSTGHVDGRIRGCKSSAASVLDYRHFMPNSFIEPATLGFSEAFSRTTRECPDTSRARSWYSHSFWSKGFIMCTTTTPWFRGPSTWICKLIRKSFNKEIGMVHTWKFMRICSRPSRSFSTVVLEHIVNLSVLELQFETRNIRNRSIPRPSTSGVLAESLDLSSVTEELCTSRVVFDPFDSFLKLPCPAVWRKDILV